MVGFVLVDLLEVKNGGLEASGRILFWVSCGEKFRMEEGLD